MSCETTFVLRNDCESISFNGIEGLRVIYQKYFQPYDVVFDGKRTIYFGLMAYGDYTENILKNAKTKFSIYFVMGFDNCVDWQIEKAKERINKFINDGNNGEKTR